MTPTIIISGPPVPWARARRAGNHYFVDAKTAAHKARVRAALKECVDECIMKPRTVAVSMLFVLPRPKKGKYADPIDRRDIDNLIKLVFDAGNGVAWQDDGQVCTLKNVSKVYAGELAGPTRTEIVIDA